MYLFNCTAFYTVRPVLCPPPPPPNSSTTSRSPSSVQISFCSHCWLVPVLLTAHCLLPAYYAKALFPLAAVTLLLFFVCLVICLWTSPLWGFEVIVKPGDVSEKVNEQQTVAPPPSQVKTQAASVNRADLQLWIRHFENISRWYDDNDALVKWLVRSWCFSFFLKNKKVLSLRSVVVVVMSDVRRQPSGSEGIGPTL